VSRTQWWQKTVSVKSCLKMLSENGPPSISSQVQSVCFCTFPQNVLDEATSRFGTFNVHHHVVVVLFVHLKSEDLGPSKHKHCEEFW